MKTSLLLSALTCAAIYPMFPASSSAAERTPVAGVTRQEDPQPATRALLTRDANRLIRWDSWLYPCAFTASALEQIQAKINSGEIPVGSVSIEENEQLFNAVKKGAANGIAPMQEALSTGELQLPKNVKLKVWTFRHNYGDTGLYQLYVSACFQLEVGKVFCPSQEELPFKDVQAIQYEFDDPNFRNAGTVTPVFEGVEIWRGVVIRVDTKGVVSVIGNEADVNAGFFDGKVWTRTDVKASPVADWEMASVLPRAAYDPAAAKDRPPYFHPSDRKTPVQRLAGEANLPVTDPTAGMQTGKASGGTVKVRKGWFGHHR